MSFDLRGSKQEKKLKCELGCGHEEKFSEKRSLNMFLAHLSKRSQIEDDYVGVWVSRTELRFINYTTYITIEMSGLHLDNGMKVNVALGSFL